MKKLVGIIIVTLLIVTIILPVSGRISFVNNEKTIEDSYYKNSASENTKLKWMIASKGLRCLRSYWIHVPSSYDGSEAIPLVIAITGSTSFSLRYPFWYFSWCWLEDYTNFSSKADEEGFIVVYPNAKLMFETDYKEFGFFFDVPSYPDWFLWRNLVDEVGFIRDLIEKMQQEYEIDMNRIYITGISNGAALTCYLAAELSDIVAAASPVAGVYVAFKDKDEEEYRYPPDPENPVSIIAFHGTEDCYEGECGTHVGVNESVQFWVEHNNCNPDPEVNISESGFIIRNSYTGGDDGTEVNLYTIVGGGHWWPGNDWTGPLEDTIKEISATDLIWEFFEAHPKQ